jgi:nicotinic acid mononucleotide adenylyltransferase
MASGRVVLLFGLSADPPTGMGGHAGLVSWGATSAKVSVDGALRSVDEVWVLPVFHHAFSEKKKMTPYVHRLAMARLAFEHLPGLEGRVKVLETEREVTESNTASGFVGTLDVVKWLQARYPDTHFAVLMGGDTYRDYHAGLWKGGRELEKRVPIVAVPRAGVETNELPAGPALSDVSSRSLRASADPALWKREVQPEVRKYVLAHGLYPLSAGQQRKGR